MQFGRLIAIACALAVAQFGSGPTLAADAAGTWSTEGGKAQVRIGPCGADLCGAIVSLAEPNDPETGRPKTDKNNPDPARRNRSLVGVRILTGMKPDGANKWSGRIYDAQNGKTVNGTMTLNGARSLKLEGCALGGMICRSQTWTRIN